MKQSSGTGQGAPLDARYENGQSDAEKLMRRHLQTPDHVITDAELKNLNVSATEVPVETVVSATTTDTNTATETDKLF